MALLTAGVWSEIKYKQHDGRQGQH